MIKVSKLYVYPIKSLQTRVSDQLSLGNKGPVGDREWMLIDTDHRAVTLREEPRLVDFSCHLRPDQIVLQYGNEELIIDHADAQRTDTEVKLFSKPYTATAYHQEASRWIAERLGRDVALVKAPADRPVRTLPNYQVNFPDSSQYLLVSQASLDLLAKKTGVSISAQRFRPNIVVKGVEAHGEDLWKDITIGSERFTSHKLCGRCKVITIDPSSGEMDLSILSQLASYRKIDGKICLGAYFLRTTTGSSYLSVGDSVGVMA